MTFRERIKAENEQRAREAAAREQRLIQEMEAIRRDMPPKNFFRRIGWTFGIVMFILQSLQNLLYTRAACCVAYAPFA